MLSMNKHNKLIKNKINTIQWFVFKKFLKGPENINISTRVMTKLLVLLVQPFHPAAECWFYSPLLHVPHKAGDFMTG
jgi:hypothetical protein